MDQHKVFWLALDFGLFLVGIGILVPLIAIQHYILDCYSKRGAASAMAGVNVLQFLAGTISQRKDTKQVASLAAELHKCGLVEFAPFQLAF
jgi:hypothetical protein